MLFYYSYAREVIALHSLAGKLLDRNSKESGSTVYGFKCEH